ncbi:hypothetical protein EX895_004376 [Sporisorium graminicola]|uniref:Uncharacterized protein n=1 Tax=Sporisorium graminicola TaxID=280036 RepID=A0A4U7KRT0_9BASI|nr:hypothetical protein EX895_004376 [Sporisorium graminicola]TKY86736.1 hypothetical protein EX895_004376 [Sporisorium graminicola]
MVNLRPKLVQSKLSEAQARAVLHTIAFPGFEDQQESLKATFPAATLSTLSRLQIHFLLTFPFEALSMNYEPHSSMSSHLRDVYTRFVEQRHGGGYCLQVNPLYREVLSFLGYRYFGVLGRVFSPISHSWSGLTHTASLVYLDSHLPEEAGKKVYYLSDVGYGSSPHRPILLRDGWEEFGRGSVEKFRVVRKALQPQSTFEPAPAPEATEQVDEQVESIAGNQAGWILQQSKPSGEWQDCYAFAPLQCFDEDYHASNKATSHKESVPFATMILVVRYLLHPDRLPHSAQRLQRDGLQPELYPYHPSVVEQRMIVGDKYIVKIGDDTEVSRKIESEGERVDLLKREFGLLRHVSKEEALQTISGKPSRLKETSETERKQAKTNEINGTDRTSAH